ncbi:MAG: DUF1127 domain-containing protein [Gammaproteobacteria bacterium]
MSAQLIYIERDLSRGGNGAYSLTGLIAYGSALLALWVQRHRQRRRLTRLDERLLADIGVSRQQARAEAAKPFWR